jgi:hypothetical protein
VFVLIPKWSLILGHAISANLGVVGRHNAIGLLLEVVLGSIILVQFLMRSILLKAPQM